MKRYIIIALLAFSLASCSNEEDKQSWNVQDQTTEVVRKSPMAIDCTIWSPVGTICGGWMVRWKHIIISPSWCAYGSQLPRMPEGPRRCGWQKDKLKETWNYATKFCNDLQFEGFDDWRLPATDEVEQVFAGYNKQDAFFSNFDTGTFSYWLSSPDTKDANSAMTVYFDGSQVRYPYSQEKSSEFFVRCVREF